MKLSETSRSAVTRTARQGNRRRLLLISSLGFGVAILLSACQLVTIDYVYVAETGTAGANGHIQSFAVDSQSGALRTGHTTVDSGGPNPVALAVTGDYANLYAA